MMNEWIQEYLQRERLGSARLDNFASGLELIGQKVDFLLHAVIRKSFHIGYNHT